LEIDCKNKPRAEATNKHLKKGCFVEVRTEQHAVLFENKLKQLHQEIDEDIFDRMVQA
jgi:hypothetical protein